MLLDSRNNHHVTVQACWVSTATHKSSGALCLQRASQHEESFGWSTSNKVMEIDSHQPMRTDHATQHPMSLMEEVDSSPKIHMNFYNLWHLPLGCQRAIIGSQSSSGFQTHLRPWQKAGLIRGRARRVTVWPVLRQVFVCHDVASPKADIKYRSTNLKVKEPGRTDGFNKYITHFYYSWVQSRTGLGNWTHNVICLSQ